MWVTEAVSHRMKTNDDASSKYFSNDISPLYMKCRGPFILCLACQTHLVNLSYEGITKFLFCSSNPLARSDKQWHVTVSGSKDCRCQTHTKYGANIHSLWVAMLVKDHDPNLFLYTHKWLVVVILWPGNSISYITTYQVDLKLVY